MRTDPGSMGSIRIGTLALLSVTLLAASGCILPSKGTPIYVDHRAGSFWSGKGKLIEVSEDQSECRVAVRDRALFVHTMWVECRSVHPRKS
jgi:hypothetical protein